MYIKRTAIILTAALFVTLNAGAKVKITGSVADENKAALAGATVRLAGKDSTLAAMTATDNDGTFSLKDAEDGDYVVTVSFIGYEDYRLRLDNASGDISLGSINMTPASRSLDGVTVTAANTTQRIDRQIIVPTELQRKASTNGMTLLRNMQLNRILIDEIDNTVKTTTGKDVQIRINGAEAQLAEVKALRPGSIARIEYHDMPSLRYGNAAAVIDIIVKHKTDGGNLSADLTNGISMLGLGDYQLSGNYHKGKSEVKALVNWNRRDLTWTRSNTETFNTGTQTFTNTETGHPTKVKFDNLFVSLGYVYNTEKSMLSVTMRDRLNDTPNSSTDRISTMTRADGTFDVTDKMNSNEHSPSLDIYFQTALKNNQNLYFDLVGTYISSNSDRLYSLTGNGQDENIRSQTEGNKYSVIGEGIYERTFNNSKLSFGLKHSQMFTDNRYLTDNPTTTKMTTAETYAYGEFTSRINKFTYIVGIGAMRTYNNQEGNVMEKYIARPTLTLSYDIAKNLNVRYHGYISGYSPSLADLSDVSQDIDIYQTRRGNPDLKSVTFVSNELSLSWNTPKIGVQFFGSYSYDDKPIMEQTSYENGRFIRYMDNQRGFHRIQTSLNISLRPFGDWLAVNLSPYFNRFISYGNTYTHTHSNWGFNGQLLAMYRQWVFMASVETSRHDLWGERLSEGEAGQNIAVGYNTDKWSLQLMMANPFTKLYKVEGRNLSALAPYRLLATSRDLRRFLMLNFSFNISYGKAYNQRQNRISNSDNNTGIMHSR